MRYMMNFSDWISHEVSGWGWISHSSLSLDPNHHSTSSYFCVCEVLKKSKKNEIRDREDYTQDVGMIFLQKLNSYADNAWGHYQKGMWGIPLKKEQQVSLPSSRLREMDTKLIWLLTPVLLYLLSSLSLSSFFLLFLIILLSWFSWSSPSSGESTCGFSSLSQSYLLFPLTGF